MKYKKYPSYKDSGVEWLGEIPEDWEIWKLNHIVYIITCGVAATPEYVDEGIPFLSAQNVKKNKIDLTKGHKYISNKTHLELTKNRIVKNGDLLMSRVGTIGETCIVDVDFDFSIFVSLTHLRLNNFICNSQFFIYLTESQYFKEMNISETLVGGGVGNLNVNDLREYNLPLPRIKEQQQIAKFLDNATQKMDTLIKNQERLIELLKEKRQAVISHAVTRGLNPDVKFKDSGVEWLGDVPEHWESSLLKYHTVKVTDGAHISPELENGKHYFLSVKDITTGKILFDDALLTSEESYRYMIKTGCKPEIGDILFGKDGTIGVTSIVETEIPFVVSSSVIIIRTDTNQFSKFINYCCISNFFQEQVNSFVKGAGLKRLSIQNLLKIYSTFPPFVEQQKIANYLDDKTKRIDTLIEKSKKSIKLLKEKRTALISSAVTGKIDVRELVS